MKTGHQSIPIPTDIKKRFYTNLSKILCHEWYIEICCHIVIEMHVFHLKKKMAFMPLP